MTINTNLASLGAERALQGTSSQLATSLQRLSSGLRLNSARDDAAGIAIDARLTTQVRGMNQGLRNMADGISLAQTAEGGMSSVVSSLQRIRELAVQSANFTNTSTDRIALQQEVGQLQAEITRVGNQTSFNGMRLLDGSFTTATVQASANVGEVINLGAIPDIRAAAIGVVPASVVSWTTSVTAASSANQTVQLGSNPVVNLGSFSRDAKLLAAAINSVGAAAIPGLSATAAPNVRVGASALPGIEGTNYSFTLNGQAITMTASSNVATSRANAISAINARSAITGVVASDTGNALQLIEAAGGNINLSENTVGSASFFGLGGLVSASGLGSSITIQYVLPTNSAATQLNFSNTGMAASNFAIPALIPISTVDLSTVAGANLAITAADAALATLNSARATLGAAMNRFESSIAAQRIAVEAQTAARSRIRDADFAQETAALTRAQILQQSGIAILAQANTVPRNVLALLK